MTATTTQMTGTVVVVVLIAMVAVGDVVMGETVASLIIPVAAALGVPSLPRRVEEATHERRGPSQPVSFLKGSARECAAPMTGREYPLLRNAMH